MTKIVMRSKVDEKGVLQLTLPLGAAEAAREVQITVEPIANEPSSLEAMREWVRATAGKWQGEFERPEQGEVEEREPLS